MAGELISASLAALGGLLVLAVVVAMMLVLKNYVAAQHQKTAEAIANKNTGGLKVGDDTNLDLILSLVHCFGAVFISTLLAGFFVANAEKLGKKDAVQELAAIKAFNTLNPAKPQSNYAIIERTIERHQVTEEGYVITCSDRTCGLFMPDKGREASHLVALDLRYVQQP